ncbi:hypothetical protein CHCC20496_4310 [Bacillus licheniformis]|uniref:helix-turn-helix transcriptional regulator n=1 Tax=Bacillus licheniformis TaxID=1402 RepID=UPI00046FC4B4|nr:helix-turn-helix transcriptional regulator [Bacillus licheniformis]TWJ84308.1 hypothetical protein CHCC20496_4310 [Bacillus licheniformis]
MRKWLIEHRGKRSQETIAKKAGISRGAYANIELGKRNPSVQVAKRIADELDFDWTIFFDENVVETTRESHTA